MTRRTQIMLACKRAFLACLVVGPLFLIGCGGTSQDDMRRHAIRRTSSKEESDEATPKAGVDADSDAQPRAAAVPAADASSEPAAKVPAGGTVAGKPSPQKPAHTNETAANSDAVTTRIDTLPSPAPPIEPLSPAERRKRTAGNLTRIGQAWRAYFMEKRFFPGPITNETKQPSLSWRVELLPYLGLQPLYDAFHLNEAWDSPHNITLLDKIPSEFQSPERFDAKTNYLALSLGGTTVYQERRNVLESNVEDGIENTLALVEVDEEQAVPWTQPAEFPLVMATPLKSLGKLRENGLFVVWSNGTPSWIDGTVDPHLFAKACSIDAGDGFRGSQIANDLAAGIALPTREPASSGTALAATAVDAPEAKSSGTVSATPESKRLTLGDAQAALKGRNEAEPRVLYGKAPIPSAPNLKVARDLLRELYQETYADAKSEQERLKLARKMLDRLSDLGGDLPGQYALLEVVKQIAIRAGDVEVALNATDHMTSRFELDDNTLLDTFEKVVRTAKHGRSQARLFEEADDTFDDFVLAEDYRAAERLSQLAVSAANKSDDEDAVEKYTARRHWASEAKALQKAAEAGLIALETNPQDPRANGDVGKFLCLIKGDWANGLVILAHGNDRSLKRLAEMELGDLSDSIRRLELADIWWREAASSKPALQETMQSRAKHWYEQALPGLPAGLVRIRVERRINEIGKNQPKS